MVFIGATRSRMAAMDTAAPALGAIATRRDAIRRDG